MASIKEDSLLCAYLLSSGPAMQSLARLGGSITGIDASREAVLAAQLHAQGDESISDLLSYQHGTAEDLAARGRDFKTVISHQGMSIWAKQEVISRM